MEAEHSKIRRGMLLWNSVVDFSQNSVVEILQLVERALMRRKKIETLRKHSRDGKMEEKKAGPRYRYMFL